MCVSVVSEEETFTWILKSDIRLADRQFSILSWTVSDDEWVVCTLGELLSVCVCVHKGLVAKTLWFSPIVGKLLIPLRFSPFEGILGSHWKSLCVLYHACYNCKDSSTFPLAQNWLLTLSWESWKPQLFLIYWLETHW